MVVSPSPSASSSDRRLQLVALRYASWLISAFAMIYALLAGLHTLQDFDLGWQVATGRWVFEHHYIFSSDVFSYTANGQPWIYPALSGLIFYLCFLAGGYGLLSWAGAVASAATVAVVIRKNSLATSALAVMAVPLIANRTQPRAEMFTTVLFAAFLALLWRHYRSERSTLWLLPILMLFWVNLHLGFISGLVLAGGYLFLEFIDLSFESRRQSAVARLQQAWPWLALSAGVTILNPWGPGIYTAILRQQKAQAVHNLWIVEWESVRPSWGSLQQAIDWRDPQSSFWWLTAATLVCIFFAIWRRHWGAAIFLGVSVCVAMQHVRLQALFACMTVVVGGAVIEDALRTVMERQSDNSRTRGGAWFGNVRYAAAVVFTIAILAITAVRSVDLMSNRYYMRSSQLSLFGTGLSWWYPARAIDFIQREKLPANIFNGFSLGGFLTWRLFPEYHDYIDGRAVPFSSGLFFRAYELPSQAPDSSAWRQEAESRDIRTIIVPLSRYNGMSLFPRLRDFCHSKSWVPVYLDEVSAVFVRSDAQASLIDRLRVDCDQVNFNLPVSLDAARSAGAKAELFNAWANAGAVFYSLERYSEALAFLDRAQSVFTENANVHLLRALVFQQMGRAPDAEGEFRESLNLEKNDETWFDLGLFYMTAKRYRDAARIFQESAESSSRPHEMWMMLGQADLQLRQPNSALEAFTKAEATSPFHEGGETLGASFNSLIATGRAKACYQLGDLAQAVRFQEDAVKLAPNDAKLWSGLADLYEAQGRFADASQARAHAK